MAALPHSQALHTKSMQTDPARLDALTAGGPGSQLQQQRHIGATPATEQYDHPTSQTVRARSAEKVLICGRESKHTQDLLQARSIPYWSSRLPYARHHAQAETVIDTNEKEHGTRHTRLHNEALADETQVHGQTRSKICEPAKFETHRRNSSINSN